MCLNPRIIYNKHYLPNKQNGGNVPKPTDKRQLYVAVGCGKCRECRKKRGREWLVRLQEELKRSKTATFVTLTFSDKSLAELKEITKSDNDTDIYILAVRRFLERYRKATGKSIKHFLINEYGQDYSERLHIHGILFNANLEVVEKTWQYGIADFGYKVDEQTIRYVTKYIFKPDENRPEWISTILCSKGIGRRYIDLMKENHEFKGKRTNETYRLPSGTKVGLPMYYRRNIWNEEERAKLWTQILDKEERWVNGIRIDVKSQEDWNRYYRLVAQAKVEEKALGYKYDLEWDEEKYEKRRKKLSKKFGGSKNKS